MAKKKAEKPVEAPKAEEAPKAPKITVKESLKELLVVLPDGSKRLYREVSHGAPWKTLANNYAEANKGSKIIKG